MGTRLSPQPFVPEDPGPWAGVLEVLQRRGISPGRRRAEPPNGLMLSPPPSTALTLNGLDPASTVAGTGPVRVVAAAREPALTLSATEGGMSGVSRMVRRTWSLPDLAMTSEERPAEDPAAGLPPAAYLEDLAEGDLPPCASLSPDGAYAAVPVVEPPRYYGVVALRVADRAIMRYVRFARCGAWSPDGGVLVVGGEWGLLAMAPPPPEPDPAGDPASR